jgi:NADH:ubiquinone oxidoreductase subunit 6 (subunit J)
MDELAHYPIFGVDLVIYIGAAALILFIFVALIRSMNESILKERFEIDPEWHHRIAILAILLVIIHVAVQYIEI